MQVLNLVIWEMQVHLLMELQAEDGLQYRVENIIQLDNLWAAPDPTTISSHTKPSTTGNEQHNRSLSGSGKGDRMALSILKALKDVARTAKNLSSLDNKYFYKILTVSSQYGKSFDVVSLTLPKGYAYLILAHTTCNISGSSILICTLTGVDLDGYSRSTMNSGGGCTSFGLLEPKDSDTIVTVRTYGYQNTSYKVTGKILAVRLGEFIGGGTE